MNFVEFMHAEAQALTKIIYKKYKQGNSMSFLVFLLGDGPCKVEGAPGTGHNIVAVVDAIHNYKKENPDCDIETGYQQGLMTWAKHAMDPQNIIELVTCINYELKKEKEGTHAFCVNCSNPLNTLQKNIEQHHSEIVSSMKNFDAWAKEQNEYMESNFNLHF